MLDTRSRVIFPIKPHFWSEEMEAQLGNVTCHSEVHSEEGPQ